MLILIGVIGLVALLGVFLVSVGLAVRAGDRRAVRRAVGALVGQVVLALTLGLPAAVELTHYANAHRAA
jgi:hypothetical protein